MNRKLLILLVANVFAAPAAFAQDAPSAFRYSGTVGLGGMNTDDKGAPDASKLNEYRDLSNGMLSIFDIKGRGSQYWFDLFGENIGRDDQYMDARGGRYDVFKYRVYTDQLRHNFLWNGRTPYAGAGGPMQAATFPQLDPSTWHPVNSGYRRRDTGFMFELQSTNPWYARIDANQVNWSGSKPGSSSQGTSPGNGFVELQLPVDYVTKNVTAEAGYNTRAMRFDLSWLASKFENDNKAVTWTNGYYGNGTDTTYLAPDNRYQRLMGNATFRQLRWDTTLAFRFTMDELKSTVPVGGSVLTSTTGTMTPVAANVSTYDGKVKNQTFTASAASSPMRGLDTKVYYNYRKRDEQSTEVTFTSPDSAEALPFSYKKNNAGFEAFWRLGRANRFGGGYDWLDTKREGREDFDRTKDQRVFLEWRNGTFDDLAMRLKYTRLDRDSDFLHANDGASSNESAYLNRFVTAFDLSNVNQDSWKLTLDYTMFGRLDLGFEGILKTNKYKDNTLGRLKDDRREVYLTASYALRQGARFTVFGDAEEIKYDSAHRIIGDGAQSGAYDPNTAPTAANYNWGGKIKDRNWAVGAAFDWQATEKLALKASAIYYKTDGYVDLALQEGVPSSVTRPVPVAAWDDTKKKSLNLKAMYAFSKAWGFTGGYAYEKYDYSDSQMNGYRYTVAGSSNQNSYLNGTYAQPAYTANVFYFLVNYRF